MLVSYRAIAGDWEPTITQYLLNAYCSPLYLYASNYRPLCSVSPNDQKLVRRWLNAGEYNLLELYRTSTQQPTNTRRDPNAGLLLGQRRRRWNTIHPALAKHIVFAR